MKLSTTAAATATNTTYTTNVSSIVRRVFVTFPALI